MHGHSSYGRSHRSFCIQTGEAMRFGSPLSQIFARTRNSWRPGNYYDSIRSVETSGRTSEIQANEFGGSASVRKFLKIESIGRDL
ncbi:hypothetical protein RRG08_018152 [Elysia crispata]|uniref:Uncharacterized protein n=1 Tax=Elysia crispata TaxID=231223 RepID=A0AAE1AZN3_9GAST|nr:hypothetical protein RRG08_018152 [Elysia crispata]